MRVAVGIDVAKEFHWVAVVLADGGEMLLSQRVGNDPDSIDGLITRLGRIAAEYGQVRVGIDLMGGVASLLTAMLLDAGIGVVHVPGLVVNRARRAAKGGEAKSDPRDAQTIADQLRLRDDWRVLDRPDELSVDLRLLVSRRRELVVEQTRRLNRLRETLTSLFPGLERAVEVTNLGDLRLLARYCTPEQIRRAGHRRITELDSQLSTDLDAHPDAALIRSLPGMGATLTAEFLAEAGDLSRFATGDQLASAAGLAPVLQQSGKVRYLRRATAGSKVLKFVFYQSAFCAIQRDPASKAFYTRKRAEGKRHHQALIALARRRINVLHTLLRTRQPYQPDYRRNTATAA